MPDITARIKPKKSSTAGQIPSAADLEVAEIAINTADGRLYTKHTDNSIKGMAVDPPGRKTGSFVTPSLANDTTANGTITTLGSNGLFMTVNLSHASWVRFYTTSAARTADASRLQTDDPTPGSGCLLEVISTGPNQTFTVTPASPYFNNDTVKADVIYLAVTNLSGATNAVTATVIGYAM